MKKQKDNAAKPAAPGPVDEVNAFIGWTVSALSMLRKNADSVNTVNEHRAFRELCSLVLADNIARLTEARKILSESYTLMEA